MNLALEYRRIPVMQHGNREQAKKLVKLSFFVQNTIYNAFIIVIPGFPEIGSDIGNDILSISSDILGISNRKN